MADIVLVNPRFEVSYWGLEQAMPLLCKKANLPTACLPLLAALTPPEHTVTLVDENVEEIDIERLARADIVGLTGMNVQRHRMREIVKELKRRGVFVVVGGPWVTVEEDYFDPAPDVIFVGEAEETWPRFLEDWKRGEHARRYEQSEKTDMTRVPTPRYDMLKMDRYLAGSLQFSRGCPFQCEFCDIIVTFGRRPRLKTTAQVIAELEALRRENAEIAFIVDDNLIGNKREIKTVLAEVARWQRERGFPFIFFTEASLDLAEDAELMQVMVDANIQVVFIGIESPNEASLRETKKFQNVRPHGTLVERVRRVQDAGLEVWCGMIVGFDNDDQSVFDAQRKFLEESRIIHAMTGMLAAIPKTPLHKRLAEEGRLDWSDELEFGTNVIPARMSREELRDGYIGLMRDLYEPENYFRRTEDLYITGRFRVGQTRADYWRTHRWSWLKGQTTQLARALGLYVQLMRNVPDKLLRREYRRRILKIMRARPDPTVLFVYLIKCAMHFHHYSMAQKMSRQGASLVNTY